jgi:putative transposase
LYAPFQIIEGAWNAPYEYLLGMSTYRRAHVTGGTFFFTVVTYRRRPFLCDEPVRAALRDAVRETQATFPFILDGWVLLPDHLHCIWSLPPGDAAFGKRWAIIKRAVTQKCGSLLYRKEWMNDSKRRRNESIVWQRRFWEHSIRDESDFTRHLDYLHYNPVKHGLVQQVKEWPFSTFHRYVNAGMYSEDWGSLDVAAADEEYGE